MNLASLTAFSPTALEIRAALYAAVVGAIFYWGYHTGTGHVQAAWDASKVAEAHAIEVAQANVIAAQRERDTLQTKVEQANEQIKAANDAATAAIGNSVHNLESVIRAGALSAAVGHSAEPSGAGAGPGSAAEIADQLRQTNAAIAEATAACFHDARELTGILSLQPQVTTK